MTENVSTADRIDPVICDCGRSFINETRRRKHLRHFPEGGGAGGE